MAQLVTQGVFMRDFSILDKRSVKAQLCGRGDGREQRFAAFVSKRREFTPNISDADLSAEFSASEAERDTNVDRILVRTDKMARIVAPLLKVAFYGVCAYGLYCYFLG